MSTHNIDFYEELAKIIFHLSSNTLARGYKTFFMLNSAKYEIKNTHEYQNQ